MGRYSDVKQDAELPTTTAADTKSPDVQLKQDHNGNWRASDASASGLCWTSEEEARAYCAAKGWTVA